MSPSPRFEPERGAPSGGAAGSDRARDVALAKRVRPLVGLTMFAWAMFVAVSIQRRSWGAILINVAGVVGATAFYTLLPRRPGLARVAVHFLSALAVSAVFFSAMLSGQTSSPSLWYLTAVPVAVGYLLGRRPAAAWAGICMLVGAGVEVTRRLFPLEPTFLVEPRMILVSLLVLIVLMVALVATATRLNDEHVRELEKREATIRDLLTDLEQQQAELLANRDEAIAGSRAKSDFVATVSHEIRTPLNGVLGAAGLLLDEELSSRQRELVRTIRLSGDALLVIINDILDFSKIEAGKLELEAAPFELRDQIEDALELSAAEARRKGIELTSVLAEGTPEHLLGDAGRVRQILVNLINNAVKFTEQGEVSVSVSASATEADGRVEIACAVRDTGIGIPADRLRTLFAPFSQADASMTRRFGGTGLGLVISRRIAQAMDGDISVESEDGAGSTFTLRFRAEPRSAEHMALAAPADDRAGVLCASPHRRAMVASLLRSLSVDHVVWDSADGMRAGPLDCDFFVIDEDLHERVRDAVIAARKPVVLLRARRSGAGSAAGRQGAPEVVRVLSTPVRRADLRRALLGVVGAPPAESAPAISRMPALGAEHPLRVLIAEDNPINQRVASLLLERMGYRADVAGNGAEALAATLSRPYDLILMDVRMPEMDGLEATRRIRAEAPADRRPRIVAMTANATVEDRDACRDAGMEDFLSKPIHGQDLVRVLRETRGRAHAPPQEGALDHEALGSLRRLLAHKPGEMRSMMEDYFESAERHLAGIEEALAKGDTEAAEMSAHSLKGVSGQMGARHVMAAAYRVEKAAAAGDAGAAGEHLRALRAAHHAAVPLLLAACDAAESPAA